MSWITIVWSMIVAVCLTLALQHLLLWSRQRQSWANLVFAITALATAGLAVSELLMMRATTPADLSTALRWGHVPVWVLTVALIGFVRLSLRAGRTWLGVSAGALRTLCLLPNFIGAPNLNYREPVQLRQLHFLGERIAIAQAPMNPWMLLGQLSLALVVLFVVDATVTAWQRGDQRRAVVVGGSILFFVATGSWLGGLVLWGIYLLPFMASPFYLGIAAAMSFQLSEDLLQVVQLDLKLRETEQRLALAAESARIGLWVWDIERDDLWMTAQGRAMLGFTAAEPLNLERFLANVHPEDRATLQRAVQDSLPPGGEYNREYRRILPGGQVRWIGGLGRVERSATGQPLRMRGVSLDITQRVESELVAAQHQNELARLSRVNLLGTLSGSIAHELNQPLTAILSNAQAAQRFLAAPAPDLDEVRAILHDIVADDRRASEVIRRLRALLEKGKLQRQPLDLNEVIREVLKLLRADLLHRQVVVATALAAALPPIAGDRVQLQQVLINLIVNGCDAMQTNPAGQRTLRISTTPATDRRIQLCVTDQGPGVRAEQREFIFQPFFTTKEHGMGLGLAVCRTIVNAHHGVLWVEADPGGGARFCVSVPTDADAAEESLN